MNDPVMLWLAGAVLLFWAMGAYNRLVRLRSRGLAAFVVLAGRFDQLIALVRSTLPAYVTQSVPDAQDQAGAAAADAWAALDAAAQQLQVSLKVARSKPLNAPTASALKTAFETLCSCWSRLQDLPCDLPDLAPPASLPNQWQQLALQTELARADFNETVANYNQAISQFPALLLAALFVLRPAQPI